jgi:serine/threonine protein phosphatase PrpC
MKISHAQFSDSGSRTTNQDAIGHVTYGASACFVISDGVAGVPGGEVASKLAVATVLARCADRTHSDSTSGDVLYMAIAAANQAILAEQQRTPEQRRMAATIAALLIDQRQRTAQWAHLGDSRLYLFRRGVLMARTRDHSLVQQFADAGLPCDGISPRLLHLALGVRADAGPSIANAIPLHDGDAFLLCTDGLWQQLPDHAIEHSLRIVHTVDDWLAVLIEAAKTNAGPDGQADNYSALAVWIGHPERVTLAPIR